MQVNSSWVTSDVRSSTSVHKVARPEPPSEESQRTEKELWLPFDKGIFVAVLEAKFDWA